MHAYPPPPRRLGLSRFALSGRWQVDDESATAGTGAAISVRFQAKDVYLVLSPPPGSAGRVHVLLDGREIGGAAGGDAREGTVKVSSQRLYHLVHARRVGRHRLELRPSAGVSGYAFTFG